MAFLSLGTLPWLLWLPPKNTIYFELLLSRLAMLSSVLPGTLTRQCLRRPYKKGAPSIWMKFLGRMYWWRTYCTWQKEMGMCCIIRQKNGLFQMKIMLNGLFSLALVTVDKWYRHFQEFWSKREKGNTSKGITFLPENIPPRWTVPLILKPHGNTNNSIQMVSAQVQTTVLKPELTISDKLWAGCPTTNKKFC